MKRAAQTLAQLQDPSIFEEISEGIFHVVEHVTDLDRNAQVLHQKEEWSSANILKNLADEEAAKVPILLDLVRCPDETKKKRTSKYFYNHIAKRIYSQACYLRFTDFQELIGYVKEECHGYYLDGPNDVDWIFPNSIKLERERTIYVDYVQDITEERGKCSWITPLSHNWNGGEYRTPPCVQLSQAIYEIGMASSEGLKVVAEVWEQYIPNCKTHWNEILELNKKTLVELIKRGLCSDDDPARSFIMDRWPFPLWPLEIKIETIDLVDLRQYRANRIKAIEILQEKKDPPPQISRNTVETLDRLHKDWEKQVNGREQIETDPEIPASKFRIMSFNETCNDYSLDSYKEFEKKYLDLSEEKRIALLALAWFARSHVPNWPDEYEHAKKAFQRLSIEYQIGQASHWLAGLQRWERAPTGFRPGQRNL